MPVAIQRSEEAYKGWIRVVKAQLRDDEGKSFEREIEDHGNGATVLPYDPERRVALMVRLPRAPVLLSGAREHLLEAPAGLVDDGEEPLEAARREALEEAGVKLGALEPIGFIWTMPGISTERMSMYLAPYKAADRVAEGGGLADENENITVEEIPLTELARMADGNELTDIRVLTMLLTLRIRYPHLFG